MHSLASPAKFLRIASWLAPSLLLPGVIITGAALVWGLTGAPADRLQGDAVRILYIHVPAAWLGMAGWMVIAASSLGEIVWRHPLAGVAARGAAVPGAFYTGLCLVSGSLWGRPAWGAWWVWDGRLTSMLVLLFLYLGFIALADAVVRAGQPSRVVAVFGLVGAVNIPIIHFSVLWWNSLHQPPSISLAGLATGTSAMAPDFLWPLLAATLGFSLIFGGIVLIRMRTILAHTQIESRLRRKAMGSQIA